MMERKTRINSAVHSGDETLLFGKDSVLMEWAKYLMETSISEMTMFQKLWAAWDFYGHNITIKVVTGITLAVLYLYVSGTQVIDLEQYDPVVVDHAVAAVALSCPVVYAIMLNMYYSDVETTVGLTLLTLRITCCCIVGAAMTVFLAEYFSRRIVLSLVLMGYGGWGFAYAWSVPIWRWYMYDVRQHGLVAYLPATLQDTLLRMTLLEWLTDTSFIDNMRQYFPFFLPLDASEQKRVVESLPSETQAMITKPGLINMLPPSVQEVLLPDPTATASSTSSPTPSSSSTVVALDGRRDLQASSTVGFEFQKREALQSTAVVVPTTTASNDVITDIINNKISSTVMSIVHMPSPSMLNRTAAISSFLFALQLTQSQKARVHFVLLLRVLSMAVVGSVACAAVSLRVLQMVTSVPSSRKYVALIQDIWMRSQNQRRLTNGDGTTKAALESAAKYGLATIAVLWVVRKIRQ
ncbi:hypothetical protein LEN26_009478 [Aphanomyces euteiches]|nr:hypothetical protein LEN26_009478 [Aphanomyces euteiches]KAH9193390.1 hypothetical protein AeNC1_004637 [Aphanomyces euteiches]